MPLRIAFDLDGVLADMESELVRQAEAIFGEAMTRKLQERADARDPQPETDTKHTPSPGDTVDTADTTDPGEPGEFRQASSASLADNAPPVVKVNMTARQERRLWRHVGAIENFWESLVEIEPGAVSRLVGIAADRRWEIIFLTKRPQTAGAISQVQSQRWLESKGFALPSVYVVQGSRGRIAATLGLDIVIDDRPENCLDATSTRRPERFSCGARTRRHCRWPRAVWVSVNPPDPTRNATRAVSPEPPSRLPRSCAPTLN